MNKKNTIDKKNDTLTLDLEHLFQPYQTQVESIIRESIPELGGKTHLRDACEYALLNGGKRLRPALVIMIAKILNPESDVSQAALAVEYFHTASLIADDLPCMDNDDERRQKPSTHKIYGESVALLSSYALIAAGYEHIVKNSSSLPLPAATKDRICSMALQNATYNTGLLGATGGQFLDLFPPDLSLATLKEIIHKKTVSLFEISFVFGWLFGGGDPQKVDLVKQAASHFGMAFQIADDLDDRTQDIKNKRAVNMAIIFGVEKAFQMCIKEINNFIKVSKKLNLYTAEFKSLVGLLQTMAKTHITPLQHSA